MIREPRMNNTLTEEQRDLLVNELTDALSAMMVGQEFDGGGHITKRVPPPHSAVIKAKMLLERCGAAQPNADLRQDAGSAASNAK